MLSETEDFNCNEMENKERELIEWRRFLYAGHCPQGSQVVDIPEMKSEANKEGKG